MLGLVSGLAKDRAAICGVFLVVLGMSAPARADRIVLRGGGSIQGLVISKPDAKGFVQVQTETSFKPIKFAESQIVDIIPQKTKLTEYLDRREGAAGTASGEFELGQWCDEQKLKALARRHYERTIELDKDHDLAHKKLGHVKYDDQWLTPDQYKQAQGLVKVKGKWVSPDEKARREAAIALSAEQASWKRRILSLFQSYKFGAPNKQREAELALSAIQDPQAVPGLIAVLDQDGDRASRVLLAQILGSIKGKEAAAGLASCILREPDISVCDAMAAELRKHDVDDYTPTFYKALRADHPFYINRSAWALGELRVKESALRLSQVLVTYQDKLVMDNSQGDPGGGVGFGAGGVPAPAAGARGHAAAPPANALSPGMTGMNTITTVPVPSAVVGPGVSAYGVGGVPYGANAMGSTGLVPPSLVPTPTPTPQPRMEREIYYNVEVRKALQKLTAQDFGYDIAAWKRWITSRLQSDKPPARKAPEP